MTDCLKKISSDIESTVKEVQEECNCLSLYQNDFLSTFSFKNFIHLPFLPPLQQPGWLLEYLLGPFDHQWIDNIYSDFQAGITVLLTLVPQVLINCYLSIHPHSNSNNNSFPINYRVYLKQHLQICHQFMVYIQL